MQKMSVYQKYGWIKLVMWFHGLWNCFARDIGKGSELWAGKALGHYKQREMRYSAATLKIRMLR